jgi:hypothetical protein
MQQAILEGLKARARRQPVIRWYFHRRENQRLARWVRSVEDGTPPGVFKQHVVREYARRFALRTLVETGTFLGEMVEAVASDFDRIYSIELDASLHERAIARFGHLRHVTLMQGDSGEVLAELVPELEGPCLFWLDGHYSGGVTARGSEDTPIRRELSHIFAARRLNDVILIDDARVFRGEGGYPSLSELVADIRNHLDAHISIAEDIVRVTPRLY